MCVCVCVFMIIGVGICIVQELLHGGMGIYVVMGIFLVIISEYDFSF